MVLSDFGFCTIWYYLVLSNFYIGSIYYFVVLSDFGIGTDIVWYFMVLSDFGILWYYWYFMPDFMTLSNFRIGTIW